MLTVVAPFCTSGQDTWEAMTKLATQINDKIGHPLNQGNPELIVTDVVQVSYHVENQRPAEAYAMAVLRVVESTT
jgi:hypothetical protein